MDITRSRISGVDLKKLYLARCITFEAYALFRGHVGYKSWHTRGIFDIETLSDTKCLDFFHFTKVDIHHLKTALQIPDECASQSRLRFTGLEGLCLLLARLASPGKLSHLVDVFARDRTAISRIFTWMINFIFYSQNTRIELLDHLWINQQRLETYAEHTTMFGSPLVNIVGFIDGTARPICRPIAQQQDYYSGHKKQHCLKYQAVTFPDGIIGRLDGPWQGHRHDAFMLHASRVLFDIRHRWINEDGSFFRLYGDKGYSHTKFIAAPYKGQVTRAQRRFNERLNNLRRHVEFGFGKVLNLFPFYDYHKKSKILLQPVHKTYVVAAILTNCHTCLYGSQTSIELECAPPPELDVYLS